MEIRYHLTESGKEKANAYIKGIEKKRKEILDEGLDTADYTSLPSLRDVEHNIDFENPENEKKIGSGYEYSFAWDVTDNIVADLPLRLKEGEDFIMCPMLEDFAKWSFCTGDDEDFQIEVEGYGKLPYEMTLSMDVCDDECMRVMIDGKYYYFG